MIDVSGQFVIAPEFESPMGFHNGLAIVTPSKAETASKYREWLDESIDWILSDEDATQLNQALAQNATLYQTPWQYIDQTGRVVWRSSDCSEM